MGEFLQFTVDKFTFRIAADRHYNLAGVWAKVENGRIRVGLSDYVQQRSGDVAFAEVTTVGTAVSRGDEIAAVETIKVNLSLPSPVTGEVVVANSAIETEPERINLDPYEAGWLALIEADDWAADQAQLLDPQAYLAHVKAEAEAEVREE